MLQKPLKSYNGGKSGAGTYQTIINHIPKHDVFIDAMVGNGGIVCNLNLPGTTVINDYDSSLIDKYDCTGQGNIIKENLHALAVIDKYDSNNWDLTDSNDYGSSKTFFYFDPPYLKSTRRSQKDLYEIEWDENDHIAFLEKVLQIKSLFMISHYPCELYNHYLSSCNRHTFTSQTRQGKATECIYMNYPTPTVLQDYRYIGKDYTDRQRIKRKCKRWLRKFDELPIYERQLITSMLDRKAT